MSLSDSSSKDLDENWLASLSIGSSSPSSRFGTWSNSPDRPAMRPVKKSSSGYCERRAIAGRCQKWRGTTGRCISVWRKFGEASCDSGNFVFHRKKIKVAIVR